MVLGGAFPVPTAQYIALVRIVPGALLLVGEDFIGGLDVSEEGRRAISIAMVAVGVQFECLPAVCLLESARLDGHSTAGRTALLILRCRSLHA